MRRNHNPRLTMFQAGMIALVVISAITYLGFAKSIPFRGHYEIKAAFKTSNNIRKNSFVRIAGVNVGKVVKVEHVGDDEQGAIVTMRIDKRGVPIHKDATFKIRPRIFLEGNFFVDVTPGTATAPELDDGETVPATQTATPVQLDQILTTLQSDTREDLKVLLDELSVAYSGKGSAGIRRSIPYWEPAYRDGAIVSEASLGILEHDLSNYVKNAGATAEALDKDPQQLKNFVTDFNHAAAGFAAEKARLNEAIGELPKTLAAGDPALRKLNEAFPPLRRLITDLRPATRSSGPALEAGTPFVHQLAKLASKPELGGLVSALDAVTPSLNRLNTRSKPLLEQTRLASSCQNEIILPWSQETVPDKFFPAKGPIYQEGVQFLPGISGESRSGDANGQWFRILATGGNYTLFDGNIASSLLFPIQGVNPPKPVGADGHIKRPPNRPDVPCETQEKPDLRTVPGAPPPQFKTPTPPASAEAAARAKAMDWVRAEIKREGLSGVVKLSDKDADPALLKQLGERKRAMQSKLAALLRGQH